MRSVFLFVIRAAFADIKYVNNKNFHETKCQIKFAFLAAGDSSGALGALYVSTYLKIQPSKGYLTDISRVTEPFSSIGMLTIS